MSKDKYRVEDEFWMCSPKKYGGSCIVSGEKDIISWTKTREKADLICKALNEHENKVKINKDEKAEFIKEIKSVVGFLKPFEEQKEEAYGFGDIDENEAIRIYPIYAKLLKIIESLEESK